MSQTGATPFLPFHCERLDGDFLLSPCAKNLRQVKERMDKFPSARLGPLEHCRVCRGQELITRSKPEEMQVEMRELPPEKISEARAAIKRLAKSMEKKPKKARPTKPEIDYRVVIANARRGSTY